VELGVNDTNPDIRVAVVEDDARYRRSLETFLSYICGFELVASFASARAALERVADFARRGEVPAWDVVLMDLQLPSMDGIEATRRLKSEVPEIKVIVLTVFEDPATILQAICAGADGYLLKNDRNAGLRTHLRSVISGGAPLTSEVARHLLDLVRRVELPDPEGLQGARPKRLGLTDRQQDVLRCLVQGMTYKQTAKHLRVSLNTVRTHIQAVYEKLQVSNVAEAVSRAIRDGLV
jgi:DNA-binding NarL/FixJ family response regulator